MHEDHLGAYCNGQNRRWWLGPDGRKAAGEKLDSGNISKEVLIGLVGGWETWSKRRGRTVDTSIFSAAGRIACHFLEWGSMSNKQVWGVGESSILDL